MPASEVDSFSSQANSYYQPKERMDQRGMMESVKVEDGVVKIAITNDGRGQGQGMVNLTYNLEDYLNDPRVNGDIAKAVQYIVGNIVVEKGFFNDLTHVAYITKRVYIALYETVQTS